MTTLLHITTHYVTNL